MSAREWLFTLEAVGIKLGLSQITTLLDRLGRPERAFRTITVAGTNGKGSVTALIDAGLRAAGVRTGRYTSPHLCAIEERIVINGLAVTPARFDALAERIRDAAGALADPPSFFEATTALALLAFREAGVETAVLEVGLGGRLDATNAVDAGVAVITTIDFDHQEYLGHTLPAIAAEKAGIIKPGALVVAAPQPAEAARVLADTATRQQATLLWSDEGVRVDATVDARGSLLRLTTPVRDYGAVHLALPGRHQIGNAVVAVRALEALSARGWPAVPATAIREALATVVWPARLEWLQYHGVDVLIDGAHNPAGARALASFLQEVGMAPVTCVVGVMRDKAVRDMLEALAPVTARWIATTAPSPRALAAEPLAEACRAAAAGRDVSAVPDPIAALDRACAAGGPVVVAGSLYLAGHLRGHVILC